MEIKNLKRTFQYKGEITYKGVFRLFGKHIRKSEQILDVGAGNGFLITKLNEKYNKKAIGVDKYSQGDFVFKGDISNLSFKNGTFDAILCFDVIEHLTDEILDQGFREIYRILKNNGFVIFQTLLEENLQNSVCKCMKCNHVFHRIGHVQTFTKSELFERIARAGFRIKKIKTIHFGGYSMYPKTINIIKSLRFEYILPKFMRKLLNKDIIIICTK